MASCKVIDGKRERHTSRLITSLENLNKMADSKAEKPEGVFGVVAKVECSGMTFDSQEIDLEFVVKFDDDLEPNETEIIIYNLANNTIKKLKNGSTISIRSGYADDTGIIFTGFIKQVKTTYEGPDKITTIKAYDDTSNKTVESIAYAAGVKASYILKSLINQTGLPIAVFNMRRDYVYENSVTVDGDLMENIKKYSEVCGVSTYVLKGKIYSRYIKDGDNIKFVVSEDTGMIGSPTEYEEEVNVEDFHEVVTGYDIEMLLQHRMQTAAIIQLKSRLASGTYRVRSGEHRFNESEAITTIKVM